VTTVDSHDEIRADIRAMGAALEAFNRIPTAGRRRIALNWLSDRVEADITRLRREEHIERVADAVSVVLGEP
jgi:hypothetical protein